MTDLTDQLDAIQARKDAATEGPWFLNDCEGEVVVLPEADLERVDRTADGGISSWGLPTCYRPERRILEVELDTWDEGEDEQDDQIRANAVFIAAAPTDIGFLLVLARKQQAAIDAAHPIIRDLIDPDDCSFDHDGGCQAHGYLSLQPGETCPQYDAKAWLEALEAKP